MNFHEINFNNLDCPDEFANMTWMKVCQEVHRTNTARINTQNFNRLIRDSIFQKCLSSIVHENGVRIKFTFLKGSKPLISNVVFYHEKFVWKWENFLKG